MTEESSRTSDEAQIRGLIDGRVRAIREKDVEAVLSQLRAGRSHL